MAVFNPVGVKLVMWVQEQEVSIDIGNLTVGTKEDRQRQTPGHPPKGRATRNVELRDSSCNSPWDDGSTKRSVLLSPRKHWERTDPASNS